MNFMNIIIVYIRFKKQSVEIGLTVCKRHMAYVFAYAYTQCVSTYVCLCGDLDCHCGFPSIYWGRLSDSNSELTDSVNLSTSLFWGPVIFTFQVQRYSPWFYVDAGDQNSVLTLACQVIYCWETVSATVTMY